MIVPDVNLLVYAVVDATPQHAAAHRWLVDVMNGDEPVGLALPAVFGFIRITTNRRVFQVPLAVDEAVGHVEAWLERPHVDLLVPGSRHLELAFRLLRGLGTAGNLTTDVQLAALVIEHQAELYSNDTDFGRFPQLRWVNPLA